jgi:hypothetical protein
MFDCGTDVTIEPVLINGCRFGFHQVATDGQYLFHSGLNAIRAMQIKVNCPKSDEP